MPELAQKNKEKLEFFASANCTVAKYCANKNFIIQQAYSFDESAYKQGRTDAQIISLTSQAHDLFKRSKVNEKRHLIKFLLQNLQISGENVHYEMRKPFDLLLNCSEEVRWRAL